MVRTEREGEVEDLANERVDERILDLLLPVPADAKPTPGASTVATCSNDCSSAVNGMPHMRNTRDTTWPTRP